MKKFISVALVISILLITMSITPIASDMSTLPSNVTLKSIVCDSTGNTVTAKMAFDTVLDCTVILGVYDNSEKLLNVTYEASPSTATDFSISLSGYANYLNCSAKIFFWDTLNTLKPLNVSLSGTVEPIPSSLAIITEYGMGYNTAGNETLFISFRMNGEDFPAKETTSDLFNNYSRLNPGDIVKLEFDSNNLISSIKYIWDFPWDVRSPFMYETNEPVSLATGDDAYIITNPDETLTGGVVTSFDDSKDIATIDGREYRLSKAKNIYVVDNTGRSLTIKNSAASSFKYFPDLYNTVEGTLTLTDLYGTTTETGDMSISENRLNAMKYADHIYIRTYEDTLTDLIIVKGFLDSVQ